MPEESIPMDKVLEVLESKLGVSTKCKNRLATFLYLLMRDHTPTGVIPNIVQEIDKITSYEFITFSNEHLFALAKDYADRVLTPED